MTTDDLVKMLATGAGAVDPRAAVRRYATVVGASVVVAAALMIVHLGVRPDLAHDVPVPMFWVKFAFVGWMLVAALVAALRLGRPGASLWRMPGALAAPLLAIWAIAAIAFIGADPAQRLDLLLGQTWTACPFNIALLSVPVFVAALWAMRGLAPTRLRLAGAAAGVLAGAAGALVYAFHCAELAAPFLGTWYVLGMLIPTAVGALIGPRVLRW
jgi:hypothetical protein